MSRLPSETRLDRAVKEAKRRGLGRRVSVPKALEDARAQWREFSEWGRNILHPDSLPEELAVIAAKESTPFFDTCDECKDRIQKGEPAVTLRAWAWHILAHDPEPPSTVPDSVDAEHALTERLREAAAESPTSSVPAPEPATVATDLPKPLPVAPVPPPTVYPILHRNCGIFGDCQELEDHIKIGVFVREDGLIQGGDVHDKRTWLRDFHRFPWEE